MAAAFKHVKWAHKKAEDLRVLYGQFPISTKWVYFENYVSNIDTYSTCKYTYLWTTNTTWSNKCHDANLIVWINVKKCDDAITSI